SPATRSGTAWRPRSEPTASPTSEPRIRARRRRVRPEAFHGKERRVRNAARRLAAAALPVLLFSSASTPARAVEIESVGGNPLLIDVTNTSILNYRFDNRDDSLTAIPQQVNDNYGEWLDRFNLQISWWRFRFGVRMDSAIFFATPTRDDVASTLADQK